MVFSCNIEVQGIPSVSREQRLLSTGELTPVICLYRSIAYDSEMHTQKEYIFHMIISFLTKFESVHSQKMQNQRLSWERAVQCGNAKMRRKPPRVGVVSSRPCSRSQERSKSFQQKNWHATFLSVKERIEPTNLWEVFENWLLLLMLFEPIFNVHTLMLYRVSESTQKYSIHSSPFVWPFPVSFQFTLEKLTHQRYALLPST